MHTHLKEDFPVRSHLSVASQRRREPESRLSRKRWQGRSHGVSGAGVGALSLKPGL